jgi:hypothetical protein
MIKRRPVFAQPGRGLPLAGPARAAGSMDRPQLGAAWSAIALEQALK